MARTPLEDVTHVVKDAAYVSVGLGLLAFQRLQVRRHELSKALNVNERLKLVEERLGALLDRS